MHAGGRRFESVILHAGGEDPAESSLTGWKEIKQETKKKRTDRETKVPVRTKRNNE